MDGKSRSIASSHAKTFPLAHCSLRRQIVGKWRPELQQQHLSIDKYKLHPFSAAGNLVNGGGAGSAGGGGAAGEAGDSINATKTRDIEMNASVSCHAEKAHCQSHKVCFSVHIPSIPPTPDTIWLHFNLAHSGDLSVDRSGRLVG